MSPSKTELRPGVWRFRVYIGRRQNGTPIQMSRMYRGGARQADRALHLFREEVERSRTPERNATLGFLLDRWLEQTAKSRAPYTLRNYRSKIDHRIKPALGHHRLDRLRAYHLDRQYRAWTDDGLAASTIRQFHGIISAALSQAVKWDWLGENPAKKATAPALRRVRPRSPSIDELQQIVRAAEADHPVWGAAFALAAVTGARRGELCALRWSHLTLVGNHEMLIDSSLSVVLRQHTTRDTKTGEARRIALDPVATELLKRHCRWQLELATLAGVQLVKNPYVLSLNANGATPVLPNSMTHAFRRVADRLDVPYHLHELRHFAATQALGAGVNVRAVADRLGHADPAMTLRVYASSLPAADQWAAEVLGRALPKADE